MDLADLTATDALAHIRAGQLTPVALAEACIARITEREPQINAMAHFDAGAFMAAARSAPAGRLQGIPVGVKDVLDTADMPSGYGSPIWTGYQPMADAAAVAWTKAEGGVIAGKTVTTEFATRKPGPTANPRNTGHTPGGSSSGSAAGVAAGYFPVAFATQTAGSIIRPAAYCGTVGYKPSFGMVSRIGMKVMASGLDTIGAIGRSVADCALLVGAVSGRDLGDPARKAERAPRIGLCRSQAWKDALPETVALFEAAASHLSRAGATVTDVELPPVFIRAAALHPVIMNAESARALGWELAHHRAHISAGLLEKLDWGLAQPEALLDEANAVFAEARLALPGVMEGFDILITPSAPGYAPAGLEWTGDPMFNSLWTGLLVPCVTVPASVGPEGLPLGVQIVAGIGADKAALHWAEWIAAAYR